MKKAGFTGFRLLDGVIVASVALLALKILGVLSWVAAPPDPSAPALPGFAHVIAHARTNYEPQDVTTTGSVPEKKEEAAAAPAPAGANASAKIGSPTERLLLERLGDRRDELRQKDRDAEVREKLLEESEKRLDARFDELKALQDKAETNTEKKAESEAASLKNLVTMYETMKPKDAARVFDRLPQTVLVPVVVQMNPRKMAEVLAAMSPASAEKLTVALANRGQTGATADATPLALPPGELPAIDAVAKPRR
jgi:flagellar motility protein MotE (MotC chaperone)